MTRIKLAWLVLPALAMSACSVGEGVGAARGAIYEYGCLKSGDYCTSDGVCGTEKTPAAYDLGPSYFAGEPIDDLREYNKGSSQIMSNRLIIRLQHSGKQIELNDVLTFDITSSYEVARCVRGFVDNGVNDWDETNCYRASDKGPGRVRVQFDSVIHASLTLKATCTANLVASAISSPVPDSYAGTPRPVIAGGAWSSWVEFEDFGSAAQNERTPDKRDPVDNRFRIGLGDRIYATTFFLTLVDDAVVNAAMQSLPPPQSLVGGTLGGDPTTGRFDFDLRRGQGAQFFP
jgi:hypothetical protein